MDAAGVDIQLVRLVLTEVVVGPDAPFSQRGLARAAGLDDDAVRDILRGTNKNPSVRTLAALADAMGKDLSVFGISPRTFYVSEERLRVALERALPHMPAVEDDAGRAQYLAEAVADDLGLPNTEQEADHPPQPDPDKHEGDGAPAAPKA